MTLSSANKAVRRLHATIGDITEVLDRYPAVGDNLDATEEAGECFALLGHYLARAAALNETLRQLEPMAASTVSLLGTTASIDLALVFLGELSCILQAELDAARGMAA